MLHNKARFKFFFISVVFLLIATAGVSQNITALVQVNYATFQMEDLRSMQESFETEIQKSFDARIVSSFPAFSGYEFNISTKLGEDYQLGGYLSYYSTGGRIHYKDYSGEFLLDQLLANYSIGLYNEFIFHDFSKSNLFLSARAGASFSEYQINTKLQLGTKLEVDRLNFKSRSVHVSPGVGYRYFLRKAFFIQAETRYELQLSEPLRLSHDKDATLIDDDGKEIKANWSGFRFGISLGVTF